MDGVIQQIHAKVFDKETVKHRIERVQNTGSFFCVCVFDMLYIKKIIAVKIIAPEN